MKLRFCVSPSKAAWQPNRSDSLGSGAAWLETQMEWIHTSCSESLPHCTYRECLWCTCSQYPWPPASLRHHGFLEWVSYMTLDKSRFSFLICGLGIILLEWMEAKITDVCNLCWYSLRGGRHNRSANKLLWLVCISVNGKTLQSRVQSKYNRVENYMCGDKKDRKTWGSNFISVILVINAMCTFICQCGL